MSDMKNSLHATEIRMIKRLSLLATRTTGKAKCEFQPKAVRSLSLCS